jgi:hypothetical protein
MTEEDNILFVRGNDDAGEYYFYLDLATRLCLQLFCFINTGVINNVSNACIHQTLSYSLNRCNFLASEDIWDDSALIKAYDKAINLAKEDISKRMGLETQTGDNKQKKFQTAKQQHRSQYHGKVRIPSTVLLNYIHAIIMYILFVQFLFKKWVVGSPCQAIYSDDGVYYEAIIIKIFENTGTCLVKFIGMITN